MPVVCPKLQYNLHRSSEEAKVSHEHLIENDGRLFVFLVPMRTAYGGDVRLSISDYRKTWGTVFWLFGEKNHIQSNKSQVRSEERHKRKKGGMLVSLVESKSS